MDVTEAEVEMVLKSMKQGKAPGPTESTSDMFKFAGRTGVEMLTKVFSKIVKTARFKSSCRMDRKPDYPTLQGKGQCIRV